MITVQVDDRAMRQALQRFADQVGKDAGPLMADEARLFLEDMMQLAPPNASKSVKKGGSGATAYQNGKKAVKRSYENSFPTFDPDYYPDGLYSRLAKQGNIAQMNKALSASGDIRRVGPFQRFKHEANRDGVGRVFKMRRDNILIRPEDIAARDKAIATKQGNVGMIKGAIAFLLQKANALAPVKSRIPGWMSKNSAKGAAWLSSRFGANMKSNKPYVQVQFGTHPEVVKSLDRAIKARTISLGKKTAALIRGRAKIIDGKFTILRKL